MIINERKRLVMLRLAMFWAIFSCFVGCADNYHPCSDVECSGHGECELIYNGDTYIPQCICDDDYLTTPDGLNCYQPAGSGDGSQPDGGVDC